MPPEGGPAQTARSWLTWALAFGLGRRVIKGAARRGDLVGRLELDPALREDPFPAYEQLRARGPISRHRIVLATVDHAACTEILRSDDFGVAGGHGELPRPLRRLLAAVYDDGARGPGRPTVDAGRGPALPHPLPQAGVAGLHRARRPRTRGADPGDRRGAARPDLGERTRPGRHRRHLRRPAAGGRRGRDPRRPAVDAPAAARVGQRRRASRSTRPVVAAVPRRRAQRSRAARVVRRPRHRPAPRRRATTCQQARAPRGRRPADRRGAARHRAAGARRRVRDHGQPDRQRRPPARTSTPTSSTCCATTPRCGPTRSRRCSATTRPSSSPLRIAHRDTEVAGTPIQRDEAVLTLLGGGQPRPAVFDGRRTRSTYDGRTRTPTSPSPPASTSASAPAWPGWRRRSRCRRSTTGSPTSRRAGCRPGGAPGCCGATSTCRPGRRRSSRGRVSRGAVT